MASASLKTKGDAASSNAWARPLQAAAGPPPGMTGAAAAAAAAPSTNTENKGERAGEPSSKKNSSSSSSSARTSSSSIQNSLRERFLDLTLSMVGQSVTVTQTNGIVLEGILHSFTPFESQPSHIRNKYVIKSVRVVDGTKGKPDGGVLAPMIIAEGSTVILPVEQVSNVLVTSMKLGTFGMNNGNSQQQATQSQDMFKTDTEISAEGVGRKGNLVAAGSAWTTGGKSTNNNSMGGGLDESSNGGGAGSRKAATGGGLGGKIGEWDQFQANEQLFDVKATFDENLYTTELDRSQMDRKKVKEAERMAKEIEGTTSTNMHISEERGHAVQGDFDEEDKYSGVLQKGATTAKIASGKSEAGAQAAAAGVAPKHKKMNYAAAAAAAKAADDKVAPPGFVAKATSTNKAPAKSAKESDKKVLEAIIKETDDTEKAPVKEAGKEKKKPTETEAKVDAKKETKSKEEKNVNDSVNDDSKSESKKSAKLNANAKSFSFNPTATTFVPGGTSAAAVPGPGIPVMAPGVPMQGQPQFMHIPAQMAQPGMNPMMNAHFAPQMHYHQGAHPYPGMDQHAPTMQPQHQPHAVHGANPYGHGGHVYVNMNPGAGGIPGGVQMQVPAGSAPYYPNPNTAAPGMHYPSGAYQGQVSSGGGHADESGGNPGYRGGNGGRGGGRRSNNAKGGRGGGGGYH